MKLSSEEKQQEIKQVWKAFVRDKECAEINSIRPEVMIAWKRCRQLNVYPFRRNAPEISDMDQWKLRLAHNEKLTLVSEPAIQYLYQFIQGYNFTVSVSDKDGYLLKVSGDPDAIISAGIGNGIVGADWSEQAIGNNPIGTAIAEDRPIYIIGYEHYCICAHHWAGAGAPVHDPSGKIIGAISICGLREKMHYHTLGMAVMTSYAIEQQLHILESIKAKDFAYHQSNVIIDSIAQGIILICNNRITLVNRITEKFLDMKSDSLMDLEISKLFSDDTIREAIYNRKRFTDYVSKINIGKRELSCTVTFRPVSGNHMNGVIVINEISRVRKLAKKIISSDAKVTFDTMIGTNLKYMETIKVAKSISKIDSSVLLLGESGTGKDLLAQSIHNYSNRSNEPYIPINCATIPKELISSELFGYEEGAFTGAKKGGSLGQFELANGGTLFLDEIGEMPLDLQATLLRVLEQWEIRRIGGQNHIPINVRIIAATNKDLLKEVNMGHFRGDLYYRLNILSIQTVPLRERKDDIEALAAYFLEKNIIKYNKNVKYIARETIELLNHYIWPGNIRELQNVIERAIALCGGEVITPDLLPVELVRYGKDEKPIDSPSEPNALLNHIQEETFSYYDSERQRLIQMLDESYWNITKVANICGLTRATIYRRMKKFNISKEHIHRI